MKSDNRDDKLEESFICGSNKYKPYVVGRTRVLRKLGNPFFGGEPENPDEWDMDRKLGTAWVIFKSEFNAIHKFMELPEPLIQIDKIWLEEMHDSEKESIYKWIIKEAGLTEAAQTEPIQETRGKQQAE